MVFLFFISKKKAQERRLTLLSQKGLWGTGDARPCLAAKGFFRQPYAIFHFSMQGNEKAASCEAAVFSYLLLPKHEALVVGVWAIALIERILPVPRRDARNIE